MKATAAAEPSFAEPPDKVFDTHSAGLAESGSQDSESEAEIDSGLSAPPSGAGAQSGFEIEASETGGTSAQKADTVAVEPDGPDDAPISIDPQQMPVRMLPISPEDLEHVEDKKLDSDFESHMTRLGDNLLPIKGGREILKDFADKEDEPESTEVVVNTEGKPKAANRAVEIALDLGSEDVEEDEQLPVLSENPSEQELIDYAEKHPSVKTVLRLFRGRVVNARKK